MLRFCKMYKGGLYLILVLLLSVITISECKSQSEVNFEISYFEDEHSTYSLEAVQQEEFKIVPEKIVNLGVTKSTLWIKVTLNDKILLPNAVLNITSPFVDSVTLFYTLKNQKKAKETLGVMVPYSKNKLEYYLPAFEIPTSKLKAPIVYLKVKSRWSMAVLVVVKSKEVFYKKRSAEYFVAGFFIGGLFLIAMYNLFLYFSTRDFSYLLYVLALLSTILSQGYVFGIFIQYLSPEWPEFSFRFPAFAISSTSIFAVLFAYNFLGIKKADGLVYYALISALFFSLFNVGLEVFYIDYLSRKTILAQVIVTAFIIFSAAIYSLVKGNKIAKYFTIAWAFYLSGLVVYILKMIGVLPHNLFTKHFMHVGTFMEAILLSFALGHKYYLVRVEKDKLEHQTREELELMVKEQTKALEQSLVEKEVLLKEVHHRVKNNLQIVISLLDLQVASVEDAKNREVLEQSKSRVYSMSLIHQKLYQSDNLAQVNMKNYLEDLFVYLQDSYHDITKNVNFICLIDDIELSLNQAVTLGLIANELLSNSFKHSIKSNKNNTIQLTLVFNENSMVLEVADSGLGFNEKEQQQGVKKTLGLFLIKSLTKQLRATVIYRYSNDLFITQLIIPNEEISSKKLLTYGFYEKQ